MYDEFNNCVSLMSSGPDSEGHWIDIYMISCDVFSMWTSASVLSGSLVLSF